MLPGAERRGEEAAGWRGEGAGGAVAGRRDGLGRTARRGVSPPKGLGGGSPGKELNAGCSPPFRPGGEAFWARGQAEPGLEAARLLSPPLFFYFRGEGKIPKILQAPLDPQTAEMARLWAKKGARKG